MQRKFIYLILIIVINLIAVIITVKSIENGEYSDEFIDKTTKTVKNNINIITNKVISEISTIKKDIILSDDKKYYNNYFTSFLDTNIEIDDILLIGEKNIYVIRRDGDTYITAIDTTVNIDIVRWSRIKSGEIIGEWDESFTIDNRADSLINLIRNTYHKILLSIGTSVLKEKEKEFITYVTYWVKDDIPFYIVIRHNEEKLFDFLTSIKNIKDANLILKSGGGNLYNIPSDISRNTSLMNMEDSTLETTIVEHHKKIMNIDTKSSVFSFNYKEVVYWSSIIKPEKNIGVDFLILTIPEYAILDYWEAIDYIKIVFLVILFIISIIIVFFLFFKKHKIEGINDKDFDINKLLEQDESRFLEFKSSLRWDYRQEKPNPDLEMVIAKTIAAFGNSDGGHLLIGVDDDKNILGLENDFKTLKKHNSDYFEIYMRNILHKMFGVKYITENLRIKFPIVEDKEICVIEVFKAKQPAYIKTKDKNGNPLEKFYVRSGNSSHELKSLQDINEYIFDRFK